MLDIFNIGNGTGYSNMDINNSIEKTLDCKVKLTAEKATDRNITQQRMIQISLTDDIITYNFYKDILKPGERINDKSKELKHALKLGR